MSVVRKLFALFTSREKRSLGGVSTAITIMALLEVVGVGSIAPFIAVSVDPSVIDRNPTLASAYHLLGFSNHIQFLIILGVAVFAAILASNAFTTFTTYWSLRFVGKCQYNFGLRRFRRYLHQPYPFFLNQNTSELSKNLLVDVNIAVSGVMMPVIQILARGLVALAITIFLVVLNPLVAVLAAGTIGTGYAVIFAIARSRLKKLGKTFNEGNRDLYKGIGEAFGAIKDVKILGKERAFEAIYSDAGKRVADSNASSQILSSLPRYVVESIAFGMIVLLVILLIASNGHLGSILPLVSVYIMAGYRLLPAFQSVFSNISTVRTYSFSVDSLYRERTQIPLSASFESGAREGTETTLPETARLQFSRCIAMESLSFVYPNAPTPALRNINLIVHRNTTVGLVGATGCGKTTLVDVLIGLLRPTDGRLLVDEEALTEETIRSWQRNFGYVSQHIFLADDSIRANIAFGIPRNEIDPVAVETASRTANLHDFVSKELHDGYETVVGERGIRLSGGQRQRIGIARALYHNPEILVLDEATSSLDTPTEDVVMDAIHNLTHTKTIIIIAHRITTVQECDAIHLMEKGRLVASGTYETLLQTEKRFRALAKVR